MNKVRVGFKKLHDDAVQPRYAHPFDAGFDLVAIEDILIQPTETKLIPTGLAFDIPAGYEIQIRPRSGISLKTKLRIANSPATIDSGYHGEVKILMENTEPEYEDYTSLDVYDINRNCTDTDPDIWWRLPVGTYLIKKGDRIAQGVLKEIPMAIFEEVEELEESERGKYGFGSTGSVIKDV